MAKWVKSGAARDSDLRDRLIAKYRERTNGEQEGWRCWYYGRYISALEAGEAVVFDGWQLHDFDIPVVRRGEYAHYRVEADGRVVEVVAHRDPQDAMSIVGWDEVA